MFYDNKVDVLKEVLFYDIWVTYFGMSLHVVVPKKPLREGEHFIDNSKLFIATDRDGEVYAYFKAPDIEGNGFDASYSFTHTKPLEELGEGGLPVYWKDSLVEYTIK